MSEKGSMRLEWVKTPENGPRPILEVQLGSGNSYIAFYVDLDDISRIRDALGFVEGKYTQIGMNAEIPLQTLDDCDWEKALVDNDD